MTGTKENWENKNSLRNYPFRVTNGEFPNDVVVDCFITIRSDTNVSPCVSSLNISDRLVSIVLSDAYSGDDICVAFYLIGGENTTMVTPIGTFDTTGYIKFSETIEAPIGKHKYDLGDTVLLDHCFVCIGGHTITSQSVDGVIDDVKGDISLSFGGDFFSELYTRNLELVGVEDVIQVSLGNFTAYGVPCEPAVTTCDCRIPPIRQINNVFPDNNGNITIEGDGIIIIASKTGGVTVSATASSDQICDKDNLPYITGRLKGET
jgi:hypothetical protein